MDRKRSGAPGRPAGQAGQSARLIGKGDKNAREGTLRRVKLAGEDVDYRLFRARRRSIGMLIDHSGLTVRAPSWVSLREIESTLIDRADWVVKTLIEWRGRQIEAMPTQWRSGAALLYQGRSLTLALFPGRKKSIATDLLHLTVLHPNPANESEIEVFVGRWMKEQALALLAPRVAYFASKVTQTSPRVRLSSARTQWGSCNHKGEIRLHWRLVQLPPGIADYVVAHEVAHLIELNHSPRFWALLDTLLPGHDDARRELDALTPLLA